ncbi:MAG: lysophospholipid acyltransferase family protein [Chitinophagaceae bacterium]|jgi:KDO2-lipid IV(A) lauroyltransferase|nr:lysophospholipid acyltransferase family protein [Chitinophagaceae bacterium]
MYRIIYGFLYLASLLPMRILYGISDLSYLFIYYISRYRRKVVSSNLLQAFPDKTKNERNGIAKKFYRNFCDSFMETIKLISADEEFIKKHFYGDFSVFTYLYQKGKKCQIHSSHNFNWEYANLGIPLNIPHTLLTVYMPIANKHLDRIFKKFRSKTGAVLLPATDMRHAILSHRNTTYSLALVADQNPGDPGNAMWFNFLGKPAPFVKAPESGARRGNIPVVFCHFLKEKRGYYQVHFKLAFEEPKETKAGEITGTYVRYLEEVIRKHPEVWLWSHRRWKWDWKEEYGEIRN